MPGMEIGAQTHSPIPGAEPVKHGSDDHGAGNQMIAEYSRNMLHEPGRGLEGSSRRVLLYTDLKSLAPYPDQREPEREIELLILPGANHGAGESPFASRRRMDFFVRHLLGVGK